MIYHRARIELHAAIRDSTWTRPLTESQLHDRAYVYTDIFDGRLTIILYYLGGPNAPESVRDPSRLITTVGSLVGLLHQFATALVKGESCQILSYGSCDLELRVNDNSILLWGDQGSRPPAAHDVVEVDLQAFRAAVGRAAIQVTDFIESIERREVPDMVRELRELGTQLLPAN